MGSFGDFFRTILVPALISLSIYLLLSYAIIPLYRQHRQRYAQYLPLETISQHTSSLRSRISDAVARFILPSAWLNGRPPGSRPGSRYGSGEVNGSLFDEEEEGEGLVGFDIDTQRRVRLESSNGTGNSDRRLSRDLEEGFQDESDNEETQDHGRMASR
ncbi:hypothetical protein GJ744_002910 [Endocarpon pusillum]|uniref:Uncharacterized protein n=1 Tax=Endocarpon pusillum TaxID=364733 RepID=A0A8H7ABG0_9EURO|nr:hypothetical protein GJ744_002910 [Endocarpon pusillum]